MLKKTLLIHCFALDQEKKIANKDFISSSDPTILREEPWNTPFIKIPEEKHLAVVVVCVQYYLEELETSDKASTAINQYCFTILLFLFFHYTTCHEQIASKIYTPEKMSMV